MMREMQSDQKGVAYVEATILLPICFLIVVALYYAAIFMCQKANLQANVQNTLIYYKNVDSDTYVTAESQMSYTSGTNTESAVGSSYDTPTKLFPYRFFWMEFSASDFESFFDSMCGYMFFDDGDDVELTVTSHNYVVYKTIEATATQTVKPAVSLSLIGIPDSLVITVSGTAIVNNADDLIRNIDFAVDIISDTSLGKKASEVLDKAASLYSKFKEKFGVGKD